MPQKHKRHLLPSFPVYSCAFLGPRQLALGGGGGSSKTGIKNKIAVYDIDDDMNIATKAEFQFGSDEDVPMSMAAHVENSELVCGVNSSAVKLKAWQNENCQLLSLNGDKLELVRTKGTIFKSTDLKEVPYQRVTVLSPDGTLIAVAGGNKLSLLTYPFFRPVANPIICKEGVEIYDATFSNDTLIIATSQHLVVYTLPDMCISSSNLDDLDEMEKSTTSSDVISLKLNKIVGIPSTFKESYSKFRAVKAHPLDPNIVFAVVNTKYRDGGSQGYVCKYNTDKWKVEKTRKMTEREVTCFDISADGQLLGLGSADLSISILDAKSLWRCASIPRSHAFPPTVIKFNPASSMLVSGSFDSSIRIVNVHVPPETNNSTWYFAVLLVIALLVAILAIAAQSLEPEWTLESLEMSIAALLDSKLSAYYR